MADTFTVVFDACVFYPASLRDLLMQLATTGRFRARWSHRIQDEWIAALLRSRPDLNTDALDRTRRLMNEHVLDCIVEGYEDLIEGLTLPDPGDRHVLAAAIRCGAQAIVTSNLRHFPGEYLRTFGIEAQHPDEFVSSLLDLSPDDVAACAGTCRARCRNPAYSIEEYLEILTKRGLPQTATALRPFLDRP